VKDLRQFMLILMLFALLSGPAAPAARRVDLRLFLAGRAEAAIPPNTGYAKVIVVAKNAPTHGDYSSIQTALNNISADQYNRYLIWVAPGTYTETVTMEEYVDIMGAGEGSTIINWTGSSTANIASAATVTATAHATLSFLTVRSAFTGVGGNAIGIYAHAAAAPIITPVIRHVSVLASVTKQNGQGDVKAYGIYLDGSYVAPEISYMTIAATASGEGGGTESAYGVDGEGSSATLTHLAVTAAVTTSDTSSKAVGVSGAYFSPDMSFVTTSATTDGSGGSYGVALGGSDPILRFVTASASGAAYNYGVWLQNQASLLVSHVTTLASGGSHTYGLWTSGIDPAVDNIEYVETTGKDGTSENYGVYNYDAVPVTEHVTARASGGPSNYGWFIGQGSGTALALNHVVVSASGGSTSHNYGLQLTVTDTTTRTLMIRDSQISATGSVTYTYGIQTVDYGAGRPGLINIDNSQISGTTNSIYRTSQYTIHVAFSQLAGGSVSGTVTCRGVYDGGFTTFYSGPTCP
jgi:hypothetical protein